MSVTTHVQDDVELIMRRLRGSEPISKPVYASSPQEVEQLKNVIKTLGQKIKDMSSTLSNTQEALIAASQSRQQAVGKLETVKEEIETLTREKNQSQALFEELKMQLSEIKSRPHITAPSPELVALRDEVTSLRVEHTAWLEEKKRLEVELSQERQKGRGDASQLNSQLVRLAMNTRRLEDEVHSLTCERAATGRLLSEYKTLVEEKETLRAQDQKIKEEQQAALSESNRLIQELLTSSQEQKSESTELSLKKDEIEQQRNTLQSQLDLVRENLSQEQAHHEAARTSLVATQSVIENLRTELERSQENSASLRDQVATLQQEKEAIDMRRAEVEEQLVVRLQTITDLEEEIASHTTYIEELEGNVSLLENDIKGVSSALQQEQLAHQALQEKSLKLEQQLEKTVAELTVTKGRAEGFERLKKTVAEALSHAQTMIQLFGPIPSPELERGISVNPPNVSQRLPIGDQFEQRELF